MNISILGTNYEMIISNIAQDKALKDTCGYCDETVKKCVINDFSETKGEPNRVENISAIIKTTKRHELVHAFLNESGLASESWAANEEIVDWIAIQFPKLLKAFKEADAL